MAGISSAVNINTARVAARGEQWQAKQCVNQQ
jgi:hypothetical protein